MAFAGEVAPRRARLHRRERRHHVVRAPGGTPECDAGGGEQVGVLARQDRRHRAAGREPGHRRPDRRRSRCVAMTWRRHAGEQRRLALAALLVAGQEPVPALVGSWSAAPAPGRGRPGPCSWASAFMRGAGGEVVRVLAAAVQHDHQRQARPSKPAGSNSLKLRVPASAVKLLGEAAGAGRSAAGGASTTGRSSASTTASLDAPITRGIAASTGTDLGVGRDDIDLAHQAVEHVGRLGHRVKWALPLVHCQAAVTTPASARRALDGRRWLRRRSPRRVSPVAARIFCRIGFNGHLGGGSGPKSNPILLRCSKSLRVAVSAGLWFRPELAAAQRPGDAGDRTGDVARLLLHRRVAIEACRGWWHRARSSRCSDRAGARSPASIRPIQSSQSESARREPSMPATSPCTTRP